MEAEKIEKLLRKHTCYEGPHISSFALEAAAADIAAAHAAEMDETREALEYVESHFENLAHGKTFVVTPSTDQAWNKIKDTLAATPKRVRWMMQGTVRKLVGRYQLLCESEDAQIRIEILIAGDEMDKVKEGDPLTVAVLGGEDETN